MREIIFRGKMKSDNGEHKKGDWVYGDLVRMKDGETDKTCIYGFGEVASETVGQFTGLKDKSGKKIFEGDIVKAFLVDGTETGPIKWSDITFRFAFASPDGIAYGFDRTDEFEVIGNICDNSDFLKEVVYNA